MGVIILRYMAPVCKYELLCAVATAAVEPIYALPAHKFQPSAFLDGGSGSERDFQKMDTLIVSIIFSLSRFPICAQQHSWCKLASKLVSIFHSTLMNSRQVLC